MLPTGGLELTGGRGHLPAAVFSPLDSSRNWRRHLAAQLVGSSIKRSHLRSSGGSSDLSVSLLRGQQTVSVKDQVVNTIGFVGHMVSVHVQLYCPS